jgi:hypothetical protein
MQKISFEEVLVLFFIFFVLVILGFTVILVIEYFTKLPFLYIGGVLLVAGILDQAIARTLLDKRDLNNLDQKQRIQVALPTAVVTTAVLTYGLGFAGLVFSMFFVVIPAALFCKD